MTLSQNRLPQLPHRGRVLDARLHLLDRQLLDADGNPVGTVDDLELDGVEFGDVTHHVVPTVSALLSGHVFATRILGGVPPPMRMQTIPWHLVHQLGVTLRLRPTDMTFDVLWVENWLRDHVIGRIPGGRHAGE